MIQILTKLHKEIYKSHGGGKTTIHHAWTTGPRNLMRALAMLPAHSRAMTRDFGEVGHQGSWIEVGGHALDWADIISFELDTDPDRSCGQLTSITKTQWCKNQIAHTMREEV